MIVELYEIDNKTPVQDFIDSQSLNMQVKIYRNIDLLADAGSTLREPFSKHVTDGIFELRTSVGNNSTRIMYFFMQGDKAILTNGFVKKTQKTPKKEIELAKSRRNEYTSR